MRITCQQCSAKYTISEEKLRHGVVRLKCRQCRTLIVVQPDGSLASSGALIGGAIATAPRDSSESLEARLPAPLGSDTAATIPLPSLQELGLSPRSLDAPLAPLPPGSTRGSVPPPPPALRAVAPVLTAPLARSSVSPDGPTVLVERDTAQPPNARQVVVASLDDDEFVSPPRPEPRPSPSPRPAPVLSGKLQGAWVALDKAWRSARIRAESLPVTAYGWGILGGLAICGLLLGALIAPGESHAPRAPFDESGARKALDEAASAARNCFESTPPALAGRVEILFTPDGNAEEVTPSGGLLHAEDLECIRSSFEAVSVPPFAGPAVRLQKSVSLSGAR
jgi:predicted Zn finger-like uncharacterized protein